MENQQTQNLHPIPWKICQGILSFETLQSGKVQRSHSKYIILPG